MKTMQFDEEKYNKGKVVVDEAKASIVELHAKLADSKVEVDDLINTSKDIGLDELVGKLLAHTRRQFIEGNEIDVDDNDWFEDDEVAISITYKELREHLNKFLRIDNVSDGEVDTVACELFNDAEGIIGRMYNVLAEDCIHDDIVVERMKMLRGYSEMQDAGGKRRMYAITEGMKNLHGIPDSSAYLLGGAIYMEDIEASTGRKLTTEEEDAIINHFDDNELLDTDLVMNSLKSLGIEFAEGDDE